MSARKTVRPAEIGPGYYVAFGSTLGLVGFFEVTDYAGRGLTVWGLSRYRGSLGYRCQGGALAEWLVRQPPGVQYRRDIDRVAYWDKAVPSATTDLDAFADALRWAYGQGYRNAVVDCTERPAELDQLEVDEPDLLGMWDEDHPTHPTGDAP